MELVFPDLFVENSVDVISTIKKTKGSENIDRGAEVYSLLLIGSEFSPSQKDQIVEDLNNRDWVTADRVLENPSK